MDKNPLNGVEPWELLEWAQDLEADAEEINSGYAWRYLAGAAMILRAVAKLQRDSEFAVAPKIPHWGLTEAGGISYQPGSEKSESLIEVLQRIANDM